MAFLRTAGRAAGLLFIIVALAAAALTGGCRKAADTEETAPEIAAEDQAPAGPASWPEGAEDAARKIIAAARANERIIERLSVLCDEIGARPAGSDALEQALDWSFRTMRDDGMDVSLQAVSVSVWERGEESALLLEPGPPRPLAILGLGRSVGPPAGGSAARCATRSSSSTSR